jgi:hypothetical protein
MHIYVVSHGVYLRRGNKRKKEVEAKDRNKILKISYSYTI